MKPSDYIKKKKMQKTIDAALNMNDSSALFIEHLISKHDFSEDEVENLLKLKVYLDETLNLFFTNLIPKG